MVGDRDNDILAAKVCGIPSIGVRFGYAQPGELERAGADHIFDTMEMCIRDRCAAALCCCGSFRFPGGSDKL